jgi:hypothetical protein
VQHNASHQRRIAVSGASSNASDYMRKQLIIQNTMVKNGTYWNENMA